jgi:hypothetical protein
VKHIFRSNLTRYFIPNIGTLVLIALLLFAYRASAAPGSPPAAPETTPGTISYQGMLNDAAGQPINGNTGITFRLYNAPTGATSAALWTEAHTGANAVPVSNGLFNVLLGGLNPIPASVWSNGSVYLGVQVGADAEMTPREVIGKVPYSDVSQFGGRPNSFPYVLHLRHFALGVGNFCYGYAPGDTTAAGCDAYPGLDRFTAGLKTYVPSGNGYIGAANNLPLISNIDFANQTAIQYPRWGYAYTFFLNNLEASRSITLPVSSCNDVAVYVAQGDVSPDRLGNSVSLAYHRFPGDWSNSNLQGCPCANLTPMIQLPTGSFRISVLTRGATCTSYLNIGRQDSTLGLPLGNWIQEADLSIDWPNLRTYLGEN